MRTYNPLFTIQQIAISILVIEGILTVVCGACGVEADSDTPGLVTRWIMVTIALMGIISILIIAS